jgi:hypothetical protein
MTRKPRNMALFNRFLALQGRHIEHLYFGSNCVQKPNSDVPETLVR